MSRTYIDDMLAYAAEWNWPALAERAKGLMMSERKSQALAHAQAFRAILFDKLGVPFAQRRDDKRTCYELATHGHALDTKHNALLQSACQVIDDLVAALKE